MIGPMQPHSSPRQRRHPAQNARVMTGVLSVATMLGLTGYMAANAPTTVQVVAASASTATPATTATAAATSAAATTAATAAATQAATVAAVTQTANTSSHGS